MREPNYSSVDDIPPNKRTDLLFAAIRTYESGQVSSPAEIRNVGQRLMLMAVFDVESDAADTQLADTSQL